METNIKSYEAERQTQMKRGHKKLIETIKRNPSGIKYELLLGSVLETPLVWESDIKDWLVKLKEDQSINITGMTERQRKPKRGNTIIPINLS
jgi:hypothetical protein